MSSLHGQFLMKGAFASSMTLQLLPEEHLGPQDAAACVALRHLQQGED